MPRYHLNLRRRPGPSGLVPDPDGDEIASADLIREHALRTARDLVRNARLECIRNWYDCSFEVTDERGGHVLTVPFSELVAERDEDQD